MMTLNRSVVTMVHKFMAKGFSVPVFGNGEKDRDGCLAAMCICSMPLTIYFTFKNICLFFRRVHTCVVQHVRGRPLGFGTEDELGLSDLVVRSPAH